MIDDIYRAIQAILNKNNYGVLRPDEFNTLAGIVQLKIFNELPHDVFRMKNRRNRTGLMDALMPYANALDIFNDREIIRRETNSGFPSGFSDHFNLPSDFQYLDSVWFQNNTRIEEIDKKNGRYVLDNNLTRPDNQFLLYERRGDKVYVFPETIGLTTSGGSSVLNNDVTIYYTRKPKDPKWTYLSVSGRTVFNPNDSTFQDFELPDYFSYRLVVELALMYGIRLREQEVEQLMGQEQQEEFQRQNAI